MQSVVFSGSKFNWVMKYLVCLVFIFSISVNSVAQQHRQYFFTHYGKREGVAADNVYATTQDNKGFIWIASVNGLQRFDGTRFLTFSVRPGSTNNMPANFVTQILVDKKQRLWVNFANDKFGIFDTEKFVFTEVHVRATYADSIGHHKTLFRDQSGEVYLLTLGNVLRFDESAQAFTTSNSRFEIPRGWKIFLMFYDSVANKIWMTSDSGLAVYNLAKRRLSYRRHNIDKDPVIQAAENLSHLSHIYIDSKRRIWFQSWTPWESYYWWTANVDSTIVRFNKYNLHEQLKVYHECHGIVETRDGTIWLHGAGVFARFLEHENRFDLIFNGLTNYQGIEYETVHALFEDRENNIWVSTSNNGIFRFNPTRQAFHSIRHYTEKNNTRGTGSVLGFMNMKDGTTLTSTWGDGLYRYDRDFNNIPVNIPGLSNSFFIWSMLRSKDRRTIWMGAQPGLYIYNEENNQVVHFNPPIFKNALVRFISEDRQGNFWLATMSSGVYKCSRPPGNGKYPENILRIAGIPPHITTGNFVDARGMVWIGTIGGGVFVIDPASNKVIKRFTSDGPPNQRLLSNNVGCLLELNDSTILIAAGGLNIIHTRPQTMEHLTMADGLPSNFLESVERDGAGNAWFGMKNGICRFDLQKRTFRVFDRSDGILNDDFTAQAAYASPNGNLLFGTSNAFIVFNPLATVDSSIPVSPRISGFAVANKSLPIDSLLKNEQVDLYQGSNSLAIDFSDMSFFNSYKLKYKLEGLDIAWHEAESSNQAVYSYIPPGNYVFKILAENGHGVVGESLPLRIKVHPPFWRSWWFYGLVVLAFATFAFWYDWEKQEKRKALQTMRNQIAGDLHHEINVTLNNIYMLSEMARIKADIDAPLSKEFIGQIHDKSKTMITIMDDILWSIKPENDNMTKFTRRIRELAEALSHEHDASVLVKIDGKAKWVRLDVKHRLLFYLIFKEALETVLLFANGKKPVIEIRYAKKILSFRLHDTTANFDMAREEIIKNVQSLQDRAEQLDADLDILTEDNGVTIILLSSIK